LKSAISVGPQHFCSYIHHDWIAVIRSNNRWFLSKLRGINKHRVGITSLGRALVTDSALIERPGRPKMLRAWPACRSLIASEEVETTGVQSEQAECASAGTRFSEQPRKCESPAQGKSAAMVTVSGETAVGCALPMFRVGRRMLRSTLKGC